MVEIRFYKYIQWDDGLVTATIDRYSLIEQSLILS